MPRKIIVLFVASFLLLFIAPANPAAKIKLGTPCKKIGQERFSNDLRLVCLESKGMKKWSRLPKETQAKSTKLDWATSRSTDLGFINEYSGWFEYENDLEGPFKVVQDGYYAYFKSRFYGGASGIFRVAKYELGKARPASKLTSSESDLPIDKCQISDPPNIYQNRGFPNLRDSTRRNYLNTSKIPGPNMKVQVVPIFSPDSAKPMGKPRDDYKAYFDFLETWANYSSDGESNIEFRIPNAYLQFSNVLESYGLDHTNNHDFPGNVRFGSDLLNDIDSKIDFSGANAILVVVPPGTSHKVFRQSVLKNLQTNEGTFNVGITQPPLTLTGLDQLDSPAKKMSNLILPYWWLHEFYHAGYGLMDHHGPEGSLDEYGLGEWTLMSGNGGDLSAWEKWIMGFITDKQVHCLDTSAPQVRWIAPSSVKTNEKKLIIVPISQTKGIIIESIRPAGLYYKIPKESNGVLVYVADLEIRNSGTELKLVLPTNRNPNQKPTWLSQATLRVNESVISNGYKITIVESGNFGDVVKVEKV